MIVYKVIVEIKHEVENDWFIWMSTKHIPDVINTGNFLDFSFSKMIPNGVTPTVGYEKYEISYFCRSMKEHDNYQQEFGKKLQDEHSTKYGGQFIANREIYEDITSRMIEANGSFQNNNL
jgi:hypothetical protein